MEFDNICISGQDITNPRPDSSMLVRKASQSQVGIFRFVFGFFVSFSQIPCRSRNLYFVCFQVESIRRQQTRRQVSDSFDCPLPACGMKCAKLSELKDHLAQNHNTRLRCPLDDCPMKKHNPGHQFQQFASLWRHIKEVHQQRIRLVG